MRCFLLSLSIDLEISAMHSLRAVEGRTSGLIGTDEIVRWQARPFGIKVHHTSRITAYDAPHFFQDTMMAGAFRSFSHDHRFSEDGETTVMQDTMRFTAPIGPCGKLVEMLVLRPYMLALLKKRNKVIKDAAESEQWKMFLPLCDQT